MNNNRSFWLSFASFSSSPGDYATEETNEKGSGECN